MSQTATLAAVQRFILRVVLTLAVGVVGCEAESEPAAKPAERTPPENAEAEPAPPPAAPRGLQAALARGIVPPSFDDGTYRVDPFVAVLLYERLSADLQPFARVEEKSPAPAGYQVDGLAADDVLAQLGLQDGDIVEGLNGVPVQDADKVALALDAAENRVTVTIFREDLSFTNSYRFDGGLAWRDVIAADDAADEPPDSEAEPEAEPAAQPEADPPPAQGSTRRKRPGRSGRTPTPKTPRDPKTPTPRGSSDIKCASASSCTITRSKFDDLRASPSGLQSGVDIVPAIRNDVFSGYKLKRVSSRSPVHAFGFRSGDKITHVNGRDLTDDAQAMALYWSLGSSKVFKVRYERGGRRLVKTIRVV